MKALIPSFAAAIVCLCSPAFAATLKSGDSAPKVEVASWAQGDGVKEFEGDKVYIIEFWATWCGPCVQAIPHLNETYKKHKDEGLVVIGQNLGEDAATVSKFVKSMGEKMTYQVAVDGGSMAKQWLAAAGENGIPCAFVVNKQGKIAYIGHPMSLKEELLVKLLGEPSTKSSAPGQPAAPAAPSAKAMELATRVQSEIRAGKLAEAEATIGQLHDALSTNFGYIGGLMELDLLLAKKQPDDALQLSKLLCEDYGKNPAIAAAIAAHLVLQPDAGAPLQAAAEQIATPVSTTAGDAQASALSTLARIAFLKGDKDKAVELQTKAVPLTAKPDAAAATAAVEAYKQGRLPAAP